MLRFLWVILLLVSLEAGAIDGTIQPESDGRIHQVGVLPVAPFAFKDAEGEWDGLSVMVWKQIMEQSDLDYQFVEIATLHDAIEGIKNQELLTIVSGLNITADREAYGAFST